VHDFPVPEIWLSHRVSYGETDTMGVLYYAEYLHLFERARSEYIRRRGMSYRDVEKQGIFLPVREAQCRYRAPARYDDLLYVRTGVNEWRRASLRFVYEIRDESKTLILAEGTTQHAFVNSAGRPVAPPLWFREMCCHGQEQDASVIPQYSGKTLKKINTC
jgi:acyl-CoA thioester hydrolase